MNAPTVLDPTKYARTIYRLNKINMSDLKTGDYFVVVENNELIEGMFAAVANGSADDVEAVKLMNVVPAERPEKGVKT